jgi:HD-GYP domain-containing protein (c-di-GMP phosphodiesterase class II)
VKTFRIAIYGIEETLVHPEIKKISTEIQYLPYDVEQMLEPVPNPPDVILCYAPSDDLKLSALEIAQTLSSIYLKTPLYFISLDKKTFDKKRLIKNGFGQAFLLPWEKADLIRSMSDERVCSMLPELREYKAIKAADIRPDIVLDFSLKVYLPRSNKLLPFSQEGEPISEDKFHKLTESKTNTLFIQKDEVEKFRQYTTTVFKDLMSETDKQDKLESCIRELISDMFIEDVKENTFGASQTLLSEVKDIIKILIEDSHKNIVLKVENLIHQEQNFYLHLSNVSTYGGLFALVLELPNPQDVALAGLLHDIGKINLPPEYADLPEHDLSESAKEAYKKHPEFTIDILRLRRIALSQPVMNAILQHHEAVNGTGYPKGLEGPRISKEGKVLAIANEFDNLTSIRPGKLSLSPRAALELMINNNVHESMKLDLDMLKKLKSVFPN